jgi:hypothetical protein
MPVYKQPQRKLKGKAIPITRREGPWGCGTLRLPNLLDLENLLADSDKVVSLKPRPLLAPGRFLVLIYIRGWLEPQVTMRLE